MTRVLRYVLVFGGAITGILLFLLASASENSASASASRASAVSQLIMKSVASSFRISAEIFR